MKPYIPTVALALIIGCAGPLGMTPAGSGPDYLPLTAPTIHPLESRTRIFRLENGLQVMAVPNPASPMVGLNLVIRVGSAYEDYSTSGMSHMLEHLLFNGTVQRTQQELYDETDYYGAYSNAHTDQFFTEFMLLLPAEFIAQGMDIQTDMIFNSTLPEEKFEKERGIVMEEIRRGRDRETTAVADYFQRLNYGETGPGLPTLGTISTIEHLSREETYRFYKDHYVPNNMVLAVIGNFDAERLEDLLEKYYGGYPPRPVPAYRGPLQFLQRGEVNRIDGPVNKTYGQVVFEAPPFGAPEHLSYELFTTLLDDVLQDALPEYGTSVSYSAYPDVGRLVVAFSTDRSGEVETVFARIVEEIARAENHLARIITAEKLALLIKQQTVENYSLLESPHYYGMMKAADLALGGAAYAVNRLARASALSAEEVIENVQGFSRLPQQFNLYSPQAAAEEREGAGEVVLEKTILPSGAVLITATSGGSKMFGMHILIKNRQVLEDSLEGGAEILHSLLDSGTDEYTEEQLKRELQALGAELKVMDLGYIPYDDYYNRPDYGYIRFSCLEEDAFRGIELVAQMLDRTVLDEAKLEEALQAARRRVGMQTGTGLYTVTREFNRLLFGKSHPAARSVSGSMESLSRITLDNLRILQETYFRPENYIISISSGLTHEELVGKFVALWPNPGAPRNRQAAAILSPAGRQEKVIDLGKEQAQIRMGYTFRIDPSDQPAFGLMTALLSDRMMFDLRETRGLAYRLGLSEGHDGDTSWLTAVMGTGTANVEQALNGIKSYFNPARLDDLSQKELEKTINARSGRYMMRTLTRIGQAYYMGYHEYYDGDYTLAFTRRESYRGLTVTDIQRVARKYLTLPDNYTLVITE